MTDRWSSQLTKLTLLASIVTLCGCASIFDGHRQSIMVRTIPPAAAFTVFDVNTGKRIDEGMTPANLMLRRGRKYMKPAHYRIVFEKEGFEPRIVDLAGRVNGWYVSGNLLLGGLVGWLVVDPMTGGMWTLEPDEVTIDFEAPQKQTSVPANTVLRVVTIDQIPVAGRSRLLSVVPATSLP